MGTASSLNNVSHSVKLRQYICVGVYRSEELNVSYKFLLNGEQLCFRRGYSTPETLQPVAKDIFQAGDLHFQFERDEHNHVCAFTIRAGMVWSIRLNRCLG
jgi:hypothetical protein